MVRVQPHAMSFKKHVFKKIAESWPCARQLLFALIESGQIAWQTGQERAVPYMPGACIE